jgi:phosphoribosylformylglycinamidine synthase II
MKQKKHWKDIASLEDALAHGLTEKEFAHVAQALGRDLNMVELGVCSALFSEHCSYKSSKVHLRNLPTEGPRVLQGPGENAGVIDIGDGMAVAFKVESHNHPSYIEPYQGAATGVGGILRDVFTMGARPIALLNALRFGTLDHPRTKYLVKRVVAGIGGYGNCMGIPTVGGETYFHESYNGNCLVNAFALGIVEHDKIFLGAASGAGNAVFYVGSKTGRDGIHGASMASESFDDNSEEKRPTVQVGDPFQEKLLLEACLEIMATGAVVGIQDMGAAGITSSSYEMADRAGMGLVLHLDKVPQREEGMNPYEIMLSESQERMLVVIQKGRESEVLRVFKKWDLDAEQIGEVVEGGNVDLYWKGECFSSIPASVLTKSVPQYRWPEAPPTDYPERISGAPVPPEDLTQEELQSRWLGMLSSLNVCSRAPLFRQYDSTVRSNTVVHPGGDAAVVRVKNTRALEEAQCTRTSYTQREIAPSDANKPEKGIAMTLDCNSRYCAIDPRQGAALSLAEACRNIASVGAAPIGISDNLNFGSPQKPEGMWQIAESVRGLSEAARAFEVPVISGNVSLYNETKGKAIFPTPLLAVVGLMEDASRAIGAHFVKDGDVVFVLGKTNGSELGGSEYRAQFGGRAGETRGPLPYLDYDLELKTANLVRALIQQQLLRSCHDISQGGLAIALAECCFGTYGAMGVSIAIEGEDLHKNAFEGLLFAESGARYIISCSPDSESSVRNACKQAGIPITLSGKVGGSTISIKGIAEMPVTSTYQAWKAPLEAIFNS